MLNTLMITTQCSIVAFIISASLLVGCDSSPVISQTSDEITHQNTDATSNYIGSNTCADCHQEAYQDWQQSHHDLAMQPMSADTVLADFNNSSFEHQGIKTDFFLAEGAYKVRTAGPDGNINVFPLRYTFGTHPLQQYLAELPNGRLQALSIAWDSRKKTEGGQRWFHLYGDEPIDHKDVLHWTRQSQNWDTMCAACHSTGLIKKYDVVTDQFDTTWQEINVACESCHGPGEGHLAWLNQPDDQDAKGFERSFNERDNVTWVLDTVTGNSKRSQPRVGEKEISACASCHSRRTKTVTGPASDNAFLNDHIPALIDPGLYFSDGQPRDEVYVYGSFLQSKMYKEGVTCSDCHNPHSLELRAPGPQVCLQCHAAETFATEKHHLHKLGSEGANCVECHMPPTTYMQVDPRHDHSFRTPKPWLSETYGTPDACQNCHTDKTSAWSTSILKTTGIKPDNHWSQLFAAAINETSTPDPTDIQQLTSGEETPDIIKATAFSNGLFTLRPDALTLLTDSLNSDNNLLRWGAARGLNYTNPAIQARLAPPLLEDPIKAIRLEALPIVLSLG
ncbi:MAG: multiheme c-type cytochrome, partial [Gammaproteobacteria bacterium]|nr:multiheme c-type cytochrome [Gammaproteobacteria bacterium]